MMVTEDFTCDSHRSFEVKVTGDFQVKVAGDFTCDSDRKFASESHL